MREFKFRVWDIEDTTMRSCLGFDDIRVYVDGDIEVPKDKSIIQQFIGLKDKNEKEIYEGDIIKYKRRWEPNMSKVEIGFIDFDSPGYWIYFDKEKNCSTGIINILQANTITSCEVIGNIYENPELLNEDKCTKDEVEE